MPETPLADKIALVTGGSRGIGRGVALRLARAGADVVIVDLRDDAAGRDTIAEIEEIGRKGWLFSADVGVYEEVRAMVTSVFQQVRHVDILVNNAGDGGNYWGPFHEMPPELWDRLLSVNLSSAFYVTREVVRRMIERGSTLGRVINIGSIQGLITNPWGKISSYQAAKAGVVMLTKCLATEFGTSGTTVNCIAPGAIATESMLDATRFPDAEADTAAFSKRIPLGRRGTPADVANIVAFLATDDAAYVTGQTIYVDGGMSGSGRFIWR